MDGDDLRNATLDSEYPSGPVLVHVVDRDYEYWLEVTEVRTTTLIDTGWINGILIETKPILDGVRARKSIFTPRPYFQPQPVKNPLSAEELHNMQLNGELDWIPQERPKITEVIRRVPELDAESTEIIGIAHTPLRGRMYDVEPAPDITHDTPEHLLDRINQGELDNLYFQRDDQGRIHVHEEPQPLRQITHPPKPQPATDLSEPHYNTARETNAQLIANAFGITREDVKNAIVWTDTPDNTAGTTEE